MKISRGNIIIVSVSLALIVGAYFSYRYFFRSANKKTSRKIIFINKEPNSNALIIRNYDSVWDYKLENGIWYTKKKTSEGWLDMKKTLSAENYNNSVSKLEKFIA